MSSHLRSRLKKVLTPAVSPTVRVADGSRTSVLGMCTARVTVAGHHTSVLFAVLDACPHDVILGIDFLTAHSALIDCSAGTLRLELPLCSDVTSANRTRLRSVECLRIPPQAAMYVHMSPFPPVPDGDYLVAPVIDLTLSRNIALPHTIVSVANNRTLVPILDFSASTQVLPEGIALAELSTLEQCTVSAFTPDTQTVAEPVITAHNKAFLDKMIASDLLPSQVEALRSVLFSYLDIFDLDDRPLGRTRVVAHRIDTGDASPLHKRPYRVSHPERQIIQKEVEKMLDKDVIEPSSSPWASPVVADEQRRDPSLRSIIDRLQTGDTDPSLSTLTG
ncbi:uncharacterized protein LOC125759160 [Rhipicephalus sanguineus]|uniref:uncharacterized protein LOC125759160 n=1 Tax=Rhipicephalus sanguineus TaxID=34632 RepID=UPI0020C32EC2|nr:uncharacterized protein LOC125759160 [Rhipicephalus sanguineus]